MLPLLACIATLQSPQISIKAGYYTLRELAVQLRSGGVRVSANDDCAKDVYALNLDTVSWGDLQSALMSDGRLAIVRTEEGEQLQRSVSDKTASAGVLNRFLAAVAAPIQATYGSATEACVRLQGVAPEVRASVASTDPITSNAGACDLSATWAAGNLTFATMAVAAELSRPERPAFCALYTAAFDQAPRLVAPKGDLSQLPSPPGVDLKTLAKQDLDAVGRAGILQAGLNLDPLTLVSSITTLLYCPLPVCPILAFGSDSVTPQRVEPPKFEWSAILGTSALRDMSQRASKRLTEAPMKVTARPMFTSAAFLEAAKLGRRNLVEYVSPMADLQVQWDGEGVQGIVDRVNQGQVDQSWLSRCASERVSPDQARFVTGPFPFPHRLTAAEVGSICVVQNELRFLDGLTAPDRTFSTGIRNLRFRGEAVPLDRLIDELLRMPMAKWRDSYYGSDALDIANPIRMRPFAFAIAKSARLRRALKELQPGSRLEIPLNEIESGAVADLVGRISEVAGFSTGQCVFGTPGLIAQLFREADGRNAKVTLDQKEGRTVIRFEQYGESPWSAWMEHVDVK